jgi:hypothetical protein
MNMGKENTITPWLAFGNSGKRQGFFGLHAVFAGKFTTEVNEYSGFSGCNLGNTTADLIRPAVDGYNHHLTPSPFHTIVGFNFFVLSQCISHHLHIALHGSVGHPVTGEVLPVPFFQILIRFKKTICRGPS